MEFLKNVAYFSLAAACCCGCASVDPARKVLWDGLPPQADPDAVARKIIAQFMSTEPDKYQAKGFNFFLDSIDLVQSKKGLMQAAMKEAADALADVADQYIYSLTDPSVVTVTNNAATSVSILDTISEARKILMEHSVPNSAKISLEVSPAVEQKLVLAKVLRSTDNAEDLGRGYIGKFMGFDIYVTNNITANDQGAYRCVARTGRAIAFAEQVNSVKAYEPELRHGDAVKGLHLYGAKILYPKEMVFLDLTPAPEATA